MEYKDEHIQLEFQAIKDTPGAEFLILNQNHPSDTEVNMKKKQKNCLYILSKYFHIDSIFITHYCKYI